MAKILVVEDDQMMGRMYQKIFQLEGYQIELAENGQDGLEKAKSFKPELILLDIMMPKMNGLEFLDNKKADPQIANIPTIALSNLANPLDADKAIQKGALKYIVKSQYEPKQILELVKQALAGTLKPDVLPKTTQPAPVSQAQTADTKQPTTKIDPLAPSAPLKED